MSMVAAGVCTRDILTPASIHNAMVTHAAFGGSTNLVLHIPAIAHSAGLPRPGVRDWERINRLVPRLVDALPNGPRNHPTIHVFLAGGVPEVMLHLRRAGLLETSARVVGGGTLGEQLDAWQTSERRHRLRKRLRDRDGVDPDDVILSPDAAKARGLTSTVCFPIGNLAPQGSVVKSTSIDPSVVDADGVYRKVGPAKVFHSEPAAVAAIKAKQIEAGDILVLACRGPMGAGMEETSQLTSALRHCSWGKHVALLTDARFSGLSAGACLGHVSPEALAGGPIGKLREGDVIEIVIDRNKLEGSVNLVGEGVGETGRRFDATEGAHVLAARETRADLAADAAMPDETRLWAALQDASGGPWGGCVYDVESILKVLAAGKKVLAAENKIGDE
jgi:putative YjhG/YagF family dehydratase